jgi:Leucine-rich repeat (LRR) protein
MAHGPDTPILLERIAKCIADNLVNLDLSYLNITSLPPLPEHVRELNCHNTNITFLPDLPERLVILSCARTCLTSLPALPVSLAMLTCARTPITSLPELPKHLTALWCESTLLTTLPELPVTLTYFYAYNTPLILKLRDNESFAEYNLRWRAWREENISKPRVQERTLAFKEELMMEVWHPDRVERWLDTGIELECM